MTVNNKLYYNNGKVILVASEPSALRRKHSEDRMNQVKNSSQVVLQALNEMNDTFINKQTTTDRQP